MSSNNLQKFYDDIYVNSPSQLETENKDFESSFSQPICKNAAEPINKKVPKDYPQVMMPFRTSITYQYQLFSEEKSLYNVYFEKENEELKIIVHEKDSNPENIYQKNYSLEELVQINDWFKIFDNMKDLLNELELLVKNENLGIKLKKEGELSLYIIIPNKMIDPIEIVVPQNGLKERKLLKEIYLSLLHIEQKHRQESKRISEKLMNLENALGLSVNHTQHEKFSIKAKENLEQMKNALKEEIQMMEKDKIKFGLNNMQTSQE